jgi:hypothetical protein
MPARRYAASGYLVPFGELKPRVETRLRRASMPEVYACVTKVLAEGRHTFAAGHIAFTMEAQ